MRILYIEDNATNVILVQRVANMGKHEVITYDDGRPALDHFEQDKPNLVLLDVQLRGGLTGLDVAHTLRVKGCTVPIIAVTAYAMKGDRQRCLDAGCDDYLAKPISVAELVTVFKRYGDAVASGKPILSTYKLPPPAKTPATPLPEIPIVLKAAAVTTPEQVVAPAADGSPVVESSPAGTPQNVPEPVAEASSSSSVVPIEAAPTVADVVPVSAPVIPDPVTAVDPVTVTLPSDTLARRAPTQINAEP